MGVGVFLFVCLFGVFCLCLFVCLGFFCLFVCLFVFVSGSFLVSGLFWAGLFALGVVCGGFFKGEGGVPPVCQRRLYSDTMCFVNE